eukprot:616136-Amorphochlora_amoeboformis.AAC.2
MHEELNRGENRGPATAEGASFELRQPWKAAKILSIREQFGYYFTSGVFDTYCNEIRLEWVVCSCSGRSYTGPPTLGEWESNDAPEIPPLGRTDCGGIPRTDAGESLAPTAGESL